MGKVINRSGRTQPAIRPANKANASMPSFVARTFLASHTSIVDFISPRRTIVIHENDDCIVLNPALLQPPVESSVIIVNIADQTKKWATLGSSTLSLCYCSPPPRHEKGYAASSVLYKKRMAASLRFGGPSISWLYQAKICAKTIGVLDLHLSKWRVVVVIIVFNLRSQTPTFMPNNTLKSPIHRPMWIRIT